MDDFVFPLMLGLDVQSLTMSLINIASPGGGESGLADSIEATLRSLSHLAVGRVGDTVIARTAAGHDKRIVIAGHLDVASKNEPLAYVEMGKLFGPGASDAKGALAMTLKAAAIGRYSSDLTFVYYAGESDANALSGLGDDLLRCDFLLLAEPTDSAVRGEALDDPCAQRLIELTDALPSSGVRIAHNPFAALDVPTVAFGPGNPSVADTSAEFVPTAELGQCEFVLRQWLTA